MADDLFELYDLRIEAVVPKTETVYCGAKAGHYFELHGEMLFLPAHQGISIYSLAALLPLLAAKQRSLDANDWLSHDELISCPDPHCSCRWRIRRMQKRTFQRSQCSYVVQEQNDTPERT